MDEDVENDSADMVSDGEKNATSSAPGSIDAGSDEDEDDGDGEGKEEDLGRGARSRAKVRAHLLYSTRHKLTALAG